jgi:hypothetical protein
MSMLDPSAHLQPVETVASAWPASRAVAALRAAGVAFALVAEDGRPQALVTAEHLEGLGDAPLAERLELLPALVAVDAAAGALDVDDLLQVSYLLMAGRAPGLVVLADGRVAGAVAAQVVAATLPLDAIGAPGERMAGNPGVPSRWYVCRKCRPQPSRRSPPGGDERPVCPRNWLHGQMEAES